MPPAAAHRTDAHPQDAVEERRRRRLAGIAIVVRWFLILSMETIRRYAFQWRDISSTPRSVSKTPGFRQIALRFAGRKALQ
ncbi:MAG: hypothetical protein H6978_12090 [Gammaproteobacteria bacterium]|nr:hypothetical protein [Gammaproteobacteria bacterium]